MFFSNRDFGKVLFSPYVHFLDIKTSPEETPIFSHWFYMLW